MDEQRKRVHEILYSTQSREELAKRIVKIEDERDMYSGLVEVMDHPDTADQLREENAELRELLSMYMTFARTAARGLSIQSAYADGMGRKLNETEMRERAMKLGIEWCR